jgi:DNA-binding NarL/FixJ family response regulator
MKILIVEDQQATIRFIEIIIKRYYPEASIISKSNIVELIDVFDNNQIDLTITDLDFDGDKRFVVLQHCFKRKIPCIVYSAHYNISFIEKAMQYKPRAYICKLGETSEFENAIKNYKKITNYMCSFISKKNMYNVEIKEPFLKPIYEEVLIEIIKGSSRKAISKKLNKTINTINSYVKDMVDQNDCNLNELIHRYSNWRKVRD